MDTNHYSVTTIISVHPTHIWSIMTDVEHWHLWTPSVSKIRLLGKGAFTVGSKALVFQPKLPPALWRVVAIEHERKFTWVSSGPGFSVTGTHEIVPLSGGSEVTLSVRYNGFLSPILSHLTGKLTRQYLGLEAAGLKQQSEDTYKR